jgi:hypothetical protein
MIKLRVETDVLHPKHSLVLGTIFTSHASDNRQIETCIFEGGVHARIRSCKLLLSFTSSKPYPAQAENAHTNSQPLAYTYDD